MSFPNASSSAVSDTAGSVLRSLRALPVRIEILDPHLVSAICGLHLGDAGQVLRQLADAGLAEPTRPASEHAAAEYRLRPEAREEAAHSPIPEANSEELLRRWAEFYLAVATHAEARFTPAHRTMPRTPQHISAVPAIEALPDGDLLDWLDRRSPDLQAAVAAVSAAGWSDVTVQLADALWPLLLRRSNSDLWLTVFGAYGLPAAENEAARTGVGDEERAVAGRMVRRMLTTLGAGLRDAGRAEEALSCFERARDSAVADDDPRDHAQALDGIGTFHQQAGHPDQALGPLGEALRIREEIGYSRGAALIRIRLGEALTALGRDSEALESFLTARRELLAVPDPFDAARALAFMGRLYLSAGHVSEGTEHLERAKEEFQAAGAGMWVARTTEWRAEAAVRGQSLGRARDLYRQARAQYTASGRDRDAARMDQRLASLNDGGQQ
jgi:tetratricopeptide (TPR) repeat protein